MLPPRRPLDGAGRQGAEPVYRWGLLRKDNYASGDVSTILGIRHFRRRHLLDRGRLPDCVGRKGRVRQWTEDEVETVLVAFGELEGISTD